MFITEISDEAYLELAARHGNVILYKEEKCEGAYVHTLAGFISIEGEIPPHFITIYEPKYDKNFIAIRTGINNTYTVVTTMYAQDGTFSAMAYALAKNEVDELLEKKELYVEVASLFPTYIDFNIKRPECS